MPKPFVACSQARESYQGKGCPATARWAKEQKIQKHRYSAAHPLVIAAMDNCTKEAVSQVPPKSVPSIALTMEATDRSVANTSLPMKVARSVASSPLTRGLVEVLRTHH